MLPITRKKILYIYILYNDFLNLYFCFSSEYFSEVLGFYWCGMCVVVAIVPLKKKSKGGDESRSYRAFSTTTTTYTTATKYIYLCYRYRFYLNIQFILLLLFSLLF